MKAELIAKLENLPVSLQKEVGDFVDFLIYKDHQKRMDVPYDYNGRKTDAFTVNENKINFEKHKIKREAGGLKGKIWMSDDFDEPLEEFKDYR